ncbi:nucleotidyl transferase AbiEii/AbiGii toxin family protein [Mucilaginibacter sp. UC70_90]
MCCGLSTFTLPSLFAGKMHALLFRKWQNRVKGRDWYDLEWYIRKGVKLDLGHFLLRAKDSGNWTEGTITKEQFLQLLGDRINSVDFDSVKDDVVRFIADDSVLEIWGAKYFSDLIANLKFEE